MILEDINKQEEVSLDLPEGVLDDVVGTHTAVKASKTQDEQDADKALDQRINTATDSSEGTQQKVTNTKEQVTYGRGKTIKELGFADIVRLGTSDHFLNYRFDENLAGVFDDLKRGGYTIGAELARSVSWGKQSFEIYDKNGRELGECIYNRDIKGRTTTTSYIEDTVYRIIGDGKMRYGPHRIHKPLILSDTFLKQPDLLFEQDENIYPGFGSFYRYLYENYGNTLSEKETLRFKKIVINYIESKSPGTIHPICIKNPSTLEIIPVVHKGKKSFKIEQQYTTLPLKDGKEQNIFLYLGSGERHG